MSADVFLCGLYGPGRQSLYSGINSKHFGSTFTVTFDSRGGSAVAQATAVTGCAVSAPSSPTKAGKTFTGWYSDTSVSELYDFSQPVRKDLTLFAGWADV